MQIQFEQKERTIIAGLLGMLHHAASTENNKEAKKFAKKVGNKFCGECQSVNLKKDELKSITSILQGMIIESTKPVPEDERPMFNDTDLEDMKKLITKLESI